MIVWSGRGILSFLVLILTMILCVFTIPQYYAGYCFIISFLVSGIFSCVFGIKWNYKNLKTYLNKETGKEVNLLNNHSIFWIQIQYWGIVFILLGIVMLIQNLNKDGIELYLNIILGLLAVVSLINFSITIYKNSFETKVKTNIQTKSNITNVETVQKPKFEKLDMKGIKPETEDHNRFLPK